MTAGRTSRARWRAATAVAALFVLAAAALAPRRAAAENRTPARSETKPGIKSGIKIGHVDLQKALASIEEGKAARARLKADADAKQRQLAAGEEELRKAGAELQKDRAQLKPEVLRAKEMQLQRKLAELQQTAARLQADLEKKQAAETGGIATKMQAVIARVAQARGVDLVLDDGRLVVYGPPALDLTAEVIRRYNAENPAARKR